MIIVGNSFARFNREATRWLGVWMAAHLTFKEHHNRCMKTARAAVAQLQSLTGTHGVETECVRVLQTACIQAIQLCVSELWWDPKQDSR
jgi:hypothetical protein